MNARHAAALALGSLACLFGLALRGALWMIAMLNGFALIYRWWRSQFINLPWDPIIVLRSFDTITLVLMMTPWALLISYVYWKPEGAWLDLLDPNSRQAN
jgi:hypothetical protein